MSTLEASLRDAGGFFKGGRVILELTEAHDLDEATLTKVRTLLETYELQLDAIVGGNAATQRLARTHGLLARLTAPTKTPEGATGNAQLEQRTLRSGQRLHHPGHIILLGDVNPGAEIVAGGNVIVWGKVRGVVHAGAMGDTDALICALALSPSQLRIANLIARAPEGQVQRAMQPEMAHIREGVIVVEPWTVRGG